MAFRPRPQHLWRLRTQALPLGQRTLIMAILNVTPDSFSDGGEHFSPDLSPRKPLDHALHLLDDGADLLDLGGESTRPNAAPLTPAEEQARVLPVVAAILRARPAALLSIDTYHAETARLALEAGAQIVNDVSGLLWDPAMPATLAATRPGVVLMHTRGRPAEWASLPPMDLDEVLPLVLNELRTRTAAALAAGIPRESLVLDPGFGFGKRLEENYPLLAHFDAFHALGFPLLAGVSRKSFLTHTLAKAGLSSTTFRPEARIHATTAANVAAILAGAHILRVHDPRPAAEAAAIADRLLNAPNSPPNLTAP